jgi:ABC-2 type transport system ATP-binding protein
MSSPVLEIVGARRRFAEQKALQDVSLSVAPGEVVALLGPNGAGKTTLMRAITGRLRLERGTVKVLGADPRTQRKARRHLGLVPQSIALYPQLTAKENLQVFARLMGVRSADCAAAVDEGLRRAGLLERADSALRHLSGGMQRRINIVAGTLHKPALLLLDEPTVGVDLAAREAIHTMLNELRDAGMSMLICTHDFEQAARIADRVAFMVEGSIVVEGPVDELVKSVFGDSKELLIALAQPADAAAEEFLRSFKLQSTRDRRLWSGPLIGGYDELPQIEERLEASGLHAAEIRLRDPGLSGVFLHLTGEELSP